MYILVVQIPSQEVFGCPGKENDSLHGFLLGVVILDVFLLVIWMIWIELDSIPWDEQTDIIMLFLFVKTLLKFNSKLTPENRPFAPKGSRIVFQASFSQGRAVIIIPSKSKGPQFQLINQPPRAT